MIFNESDLNKHWGLKSLEDLGIVQRGKSKHRPRNDSRLFENGTIPLVQTGDIKAANLFIYEANEFYNEFGLHQSKLWDEGTLCITIAANIAETAILKRRMCFPDSIVGFIPYKGKTTSLYIHYLFTYIRYRIQNSIQGSIQDNINIDYLTKLKFRIPEFAVQQKIAKVLSDLDAKIELNNRINSELEAMAKLMYEYWFVQFDFPFNFASTSLSTGAQGRPDVTLSGVEGYKSSGGKMVWNKELKREIPEGWEVKTLRKIAKTGSGGTPLSNKREYYENGNIPWINSGEVNNPFIISSEKKITKAGLENSSAKLFPKGTILMAMYGATAGKVSLIDFEASTNQAICAIMPNQDVYRYFIKFKLETLYEFLVNLSSGSARDNLSQEKIRELKFVLPDSQILDNFHKTISPFMAKILKNLKQNQELSTLRDWLLPMLMNGQVSVADAEERVEEELGMVAERRESYKKE
ncbi:restriction endonuclease subunit S [Algoriphagus confluentis]|uniref:Restriction endonuclease subunit S n=1 Tax=Algoriphagus confluentis TaxID=1697556 RepID=A0ABQ6PT64_9BACT|nr:restriction endonuclease subunit S [Algoriphagus confluentis]